MLKFNKDNVQWLEFELLADIPHLKHAVFLRHGGHSEEPFNSLNLSYDNGDRGEDVKRNIENVQNILQSNVSSPIQLFWSVQSHGTNIAFIEPHSPQVCQHIDALGTNHPHLALMIKHADCQAAIFYDTKNHFVMNVHAGWRGNVQNIYAKAIEYMKKKVGSNPSEILVGISPSLGPDDAEFINFGTEFPQELWAFQTRPTYFDLWSISEFQLQQAGILPHHIEIARISTFSNSVDYFSYRRKNLTGRHGTFAMLLSKS